MNEREKTKAELAKLMVDGSQAIAKSIGDGFRAYDESINESSEPPKASALTPELWNEIRAEVKRIMRSCPK